MSESKEDPELNRVLELLVTRALEHAGANYEQPATIDEVRNGSRPWPGRDVITMMTHAAAYGWSVGGCYAMNHWGWPKPSNEALTRHLGGPIVGDGAPKSPDPIGWRSMPTVDEVIAHQKKHAWITANGVVLSIWQARGKSCVPNNPCFGGIVVVGVLNGVVHGSFNNDEDAVPLTEVFNGESEWRPMTSRHEPAEWPDE